MFHSKCLFGPAPAAVAALFFVSTALADSIPVVNSGSLVAHFRVSNGTVARDGSGNVTSWTADNNPSLVLNSVGVNPSNIKYSSTGMNGAPVIVSSDPVATQNQVLVGAIPGSHSAATVFWLGYYNPTHTSFGNYVYSYGADGADGSQFDHQIDNTTFQLYGGAGTQSGANISGLNSTYTVWRTEYGLGTGNGHAAFAGNTNLNVTSPNGGNYNVSGNLMLFGYQNGSGVSGGFNFTGNFAELIIYDGILSAPDVAAVQSYLVGRAAGDLGEPNSSAVPEPSAWALMVGCGLWIAARRKSRLPVRL